MRLLILLICIFIYGCGGSNIEPPHRRCTDTVKINKDTCFICSLKVTENKLTNNCVSYQNYAYLCIVKQLKLK